TLDGRTVTGFDFDDATEVGAGVIDDHSDLLRHDGREREDAHRFVVADDVPAGHSHPCRAVPRLHVEVLYAIDIGRRVGVRLDRRQVLILQRIDANLADRLRAV